MKCGEEQPTTARGGEAERGELIRNAAKFPSVARASCWRTLAERHSSDEIHQKQSLRGSWPGLKGRIPNFARLAWTAN